MAFYRSGGGGANSDGKLLVLSSISSNSQESSTYNAAKAIECVDTSRWSSAISVLSFVIVGHVIRISTVAIPASFDALVYAFVVSSVAEFLAVHTSAPR